MPSLRFVEINGFKQNIEILENLPSQIVGHKGEIKPQITNGHISRHHATVCYNTEDESWLVIDGEMISGVKSVNGIRDKLGNKINGKVTLKDVGDRVYLLYMYDTNAYLEVFSTSAEKINATCNMDIDELQPEISKLVVNTSLIKGEVVKALDIANHNKEHLDQVDKEHYELTGKVESLFQILDRGLDQVEEIGNKPKQFLLGFAIFTLGAVCLLGLYGVQQNINPIIRSIFHIEVNHK